MEGGLGDRRYPLALHMVAERLNEISGRWSVEAGEVRGPGTTAVVVADHHAAGPNHIDIGFILNRDRADVPVIWDCTAGRGQDLQESLRNAVMIWSKTTAPVALEALIGDSRLADHYRGNEAAGFVGWHAIHGPVLAWGVGSHEQELQKWVLDNPLLPQLREGILPALDRPRFNGIKCLFGSSSNGDVAEVRVNGQIAADASAHLLSISWPRFEKATFVRTFVLLLHPE